MIKEPKIGDKIYVPSSCYLYRGEDDFVGGLATINRVEQINVVSHTHPNYIMIGVEERPQTLYNYQILVAEQERLSKIFKDKTVYRDPDTRPVFNDDEADWM